MLKHLALFYTVPASYWAFDFDEAMLQALGHTRDFLNRTVFDGDMAYGAHDFTWGAAAGQEPSVCFMSIGHFSHGYFEQLAMQYRGLPLAVIETDVFQEFSEPYLKRVRELTKRKIVSYPDVKSVQHLTGHCDVVVFSHDSPRFSFEKIKPLLEARQEIVLLFNLNGCTSETSTDRTDNYQCELLLSLWRHSICGMDEADAGCTDLLCLCHAPAEAVVDTFAETIDCEEFLLSSADAPRGKSQWHQDWFVYHNVLKYLPSERLRGTFLDIGAADPFLLSNSVVFERCLGWQGVCIEPNPRAAVLLDVYRENCTVVPVCLWSNDSEWSFEQGLELSTLHSPSEGKWTESWVDEETWRREGFMALRRAQTSAIGGVNLYDAKCFTLRSLSAMLGGIRADVISVDVEGAEVELFRGVGDLFSLTGALVAIIETRAATSFQTDQLLMPSGYVKLAMVGQDSIFVHLSVLQYLKNVSYPNSLQSSSGRLWTYEAFQRRFADLDKDDKREGV